MSLRQCFYACILSLLAALCCGCNSDSNTRSDSPAKEISVKSSAPIKELENIAISYGFSFGECGGYCKTEFRFSKGLMEGIKTGWDTINNPPKTCMVLIMDSDYNRLMQVINQDITEFWTLPDRIGCPDCTDGGAEWIKIEKDGKTKKVVFEYRNDVEPIKNMQFVLRELANKANGRKFNLR